MEDQALKKYSNNGKDSLLFKFALIFSIFAVVTLLMSGLATYVLQNSMYRRHVEDEISEVAQYLSLLLSDPTLDFSSHQKYVIEHGDEIMIPMDYDFNYLPAFQNFEALFAKEYPGKVFGKDVSFDEMSDELKRAHAVYVQEYCLYIFEKAVPAFNLSYTYYVVPKEEEKGCYYVIDGTRIKKEVDGKEYISIGIYKPDLEIPVLWKVWEAKERLHEFEVYDNEYGYTYGYYNPLIINGEVLGLICIDVEIATVNGQILWNVIYLIIGLAIVLFAGVIVLLIIINKKYIRKLENLVSNVKQYTDSKNPDIARFIEYDVNSNDEISLLANQTADMIYELDKYMKSLNNTARELSETRQQAKDLMALANRDSLTGIRNKTAYDEEIRKLSREAAQGMEEFGIAIVDLNYLKKINDEHGHDNGNQAIKKLCFLVCSVFKHSPVFRIGPDEFGVILKNLDYRRIDELVELFDLEIEKRITDTSLDPWERISASVGVALYEPGKDFTVEDVIKRAEANMKNRKQEMKDTGE